jgi:hypothetical protein
MNNYRRLWTILVISGLLVSSCAGTPKATTSEYLETTGAEFEHGRERDTAHYVLEFSVKQAITQPIRINVKFENPEDSAVPFELMTQLRPGQDLLSIRSPTISGFKSGRKYSVTLRGYVAGDSDPVLKHKQKVEFD